MSEGPRWVAFLEWLATYPRRTDTLAAWRAFRRIPKRLYPLLAQRTEAYARTVDPGRPDFIRHPATFLHSDWQSEPMEEVSPKAGAAVSKRVDLSAIMEAKEAARRERNAQLGDE